MSVIKVEDLYKIYKVGESKVRALNGVSFTIEKGEFCAIVGTSGSGKSTLLNMLAGLEKPTKGEIVIAGEHMETKNENELVKFRREHIGFIFQSFNLLPAMNAIENVAMPLTFQGMSKEKRIKKAEEVLELVGLSKHKNHKPTQMSGGQQQRVGIARAIATNPEIIFFDEPTSALDPELIGEVLAVMRQLATEGMTMLVVTHEISFAKQVSNKVLFMDGGKVLESGDSKDFFDNPRTKRAEEFIKNLSEHGV